MMDEGVFGGEVKVGFSVGERPGKLLRYWVEMLGAQGAAQLFLPHPPRLSG